MSEASTMNAHSPGSYSFSLMIHGAVVVVAFLSAYLFNDARKNPSNQIIELVAGPGNNYMATEAPALGSPDATGAPDIAFHAPVEQPHVAPQPYVEPTPAPSPVTPVVQTPVQPVLPAPDQVVIPSSKKTPPAKTTPKTEPTKAMSKADFDKLNASKTKNLPSSKVPTPAKQTGGSTGTGSSKPIVAPKIGKGIAGGVLGGTGMAPGAGGTALTAAERDQMDAYFALLAQRIRQAQEKPEGLSSELVVRIEFFVSAKGTIGAVKVIRSSGNRAFDDSVMKAFRSVSSIGERPDGKSDAKVADFRMREEGDN